MKLDDSRRPSLLMQVVHILRNQRLNGTKRPKLCQSRVAGVGLRVILLRRQTRSEEMKRPTGTHATRGGDAQRLICLCNVMPPNFFGLP